MRTPAVRGTQPAQGQSTQEQPPSALGQSAGACGPVCSLFFNNVGSARPSVGNDLHTSTKVLMSGS